MFKRNNTREQDIYTLVGKEAMHIQGHEGSMSVALYAGSTDFRPRERPMMMDFQARSSPDQMDLCNDVSMFNIVASR